MNTPTSADFSDVAIRMSDIIMPLIQAALHEDQRTLAEKVKEFLAVLDEFETLVDMCEPEFIVEIEDRLEHIRNLAATVRSTYGVTH